MLKVAFFLFLVTLVHSLSDQEVLERWEQFRAEHKRSYKSPTEVTKRFSIFRKNLEEIEEHNARYRNGDESYFQGVNVFADWTDEEFDNLVPKRPPRERNLTDSLGVFYGTNVTAPRSVDWRRSKAVAVPDQQGLVCGACWTFSATGAVEGQLALDTGNLFKLSKQNLIDCCKGKRYNSKGCDGGFTDDAFRYIKRNGIMLDRRYTYTAKNGACKQSGYYTKISGFRFVDKTERALERAVASVGPVSAAICAVKSLSRYEGGIYYDRRCMCEANHAILVIGYGIKDGQKYWIIKNSWGSNWGEKGYYKLKKGVRACAINSDANYPVM